MKELEFLKEQNVSEDLIHGVENSGKTMAWMRPVQGRVTRPSIPFYGKEILEMAIAGLLEGGKSPPCRSESHRKNILAENLAYAFGRPIYNVSFHVNTNSGDLIGTDTFVNNEVCLRKGSIYQCAEYGGFGILDEINMAKNDAVSVLHATLDYRRSIDVPGYDRINLHPAAHFYRNHELWICRNKRAEQSPRFPFSGDRYAGPDRGNFRVHFYKMFPEAKEKAVEQFIGVFMDLQKKSANSEISTKSLDLRGLLAAMKIVRAATFPWLQCRWEW